MTVGDYLEIGAQVVGAAAVAAAVIPAPKTSAVLKFLHSLLNILAANFGKAKNK